MKIFKGPTDAIRLDDNSYPKQIWSFIFRGKRFANFGPLGYALAHLADHKQYKNRGEMEFLGTPHRLQAIPGLFTSAANAAFMPTALIRPTDFSFRLRNLVQRRAVALYGDFCKLLPPPLTIRENDEELWSLDQFQWAEPVGTLDRVGLFLDWRRTEMDRLFTAAKSESVVIAGYEAAATA